MTPAETRGLHGIHIRASCPRCGIRREVRHDRATHPCRDCGNVIRAYDSPLRDEDVDVQWVRDGLVWRAKEVA